jgi:hypothetical protein
MKRTIPLSLLLLIAGNGLMVTQVHAGFLDKAKPLIAYSGNLAKQAFQEHQQKIAASCLVFGLFLVGLSAPATYDLIDTAQEYSSDKRMVKSGTTSADSKEFFNRSAENNKNVIKSIRNFILFAFASGIPLTALGAYLLKKG